MKSLLPLAILAALAVAALCYGETPLSLLSVGFSLPTSGFPSRLLSLSPPSSSLPFSMTSQSIAK